MWPSQIRNVMESAVSPVRVQRALQMSAPALLAFVRHKGLSRAELELVIADLAAAKRAPGRTRKEGYDDFVTRDGLGVELCRLLVTAPVVQQ
jgi:hypothetical protein